MHNPNLYYYLLRELPNEWVAAVKGTPPNRRHVVGDEIRNREVVATLIREQFNPLYQNWIYQMNSGIFIWADPSDPEGEITVDTLTAFGVPDWKDETFTQYTTIAVMYPNEKGVAIQGGKHRSLPVG